MKTFLFFLGILLTSAILSHGQDFFKGNIIASHGNSTSVYTVVDGSIYKFNSGTKVWDKKAVTPDPGGFGFELRFHLDNRGYLWTFRADGTFLYSTNEGTTWEVFGQNPAGGSAFTKILGEYIYSSGYINGNYTTYRRKADGSTDWQEIHSGDYPLDIATTANGDIYLSIYLFKVFKSSDNGATWANTGGPSHTFTSTPQTLATVGNRVLVGTYWNGVYYSDDGGSSWTSSTGFPTGQNTPLGGTRGVSKIIVKNANEVFALVKDQLGVTGWYKSNDGGLSFQPMNFPYNRWVVNWLDEAAISGSDLIVTGDHRGFFHTADDGVNWTEVNNGVNNLKPHHTIRMMKNGNDKLFALMSKGVLGAGPSESWGLLKSTDNGASWVQIDDQLSDTYNTLEDLLVTSNGHLYVTTYDPGTYQKSQDNGVTWQKNTIEGGSSTIGKTTLTWLKEVGLDSILVASYFNNIWRTLNGGTNWTELVIKPGAGVVHFDTNKKTIYAISGGQTGNDGLYKSTDLGNNWAKINSNGGYIFNKIKIYGSILFAATNNKILRSDDDGVNWVDFTPEINGNKFISSLDIVETTSPGGRTKTSEAHLLLGTYDGLFTTSLETIQWKKVADGAIYSVGVSGGQVYVGAEAGATAKAPADALKEVQFIAFSSLVGKTYGDASFQITATSTSGLPTTFASSNLNVATVSGNIVTIVGAGTTVLTASQSGNASFSPAGPKTQTLVVGKATQAITFSPLPVKDVNDVAFAVAAISSANLPVSFASDNPLVATVNGDIITIEGEGTAKITASQNGNNNYTAAMPVERTLTVIAKASQVITFAPIADRTMGGSAFTPPATSTSNLAVALSTNSDKITIAANQVTLVKPGRTTITASQAGNDSYNAAPPVDQSFCINPVKPGVTLSGPATAGATLTSSASTGNQWFKDGTALSTETNGTLVTTAAGTYKLQVKADDCASEFSTDVVVSKLNQAITFAAIADLTLGDPAFTPTATSTSNLPVTFSTTSDKITIVASQITLVKAGRVTIKASQAGNDSYNAATPVDRSFCIKPAKPTVAVSGPNTAGSILTSSSSTGNQWYRDGAIVTGETNNTIITTGGTYKVQVKVDDCVSEFSADVVMSKLNQSITFAAIADRTLGEAAFTPTATSTSNLPVTITSTSDKVAIAANQVTIVKAGRAIIKASQSGNDGYNAAPAVEQSFCIKPPKPTITISSDVSENPTLTSSASAGNQWYKDGTAIPGATGNTLVATAVGVYKVQVRVDDCVGEFSANLALVVTGNLSPENTLIAAYPNPMEDYVEVSGITGEVDGAQLFDMTGRSSLLMLEKTGEVYRGNVQHLSSGLYVLRVRDGNSVRQVRVVKK